ncbi:MAG: L,D-transpeptidase [Micromonosporaceae bacterium]|nr:L,D-transpeptidase [Micromonosporaceae bacterium]
MRLAIAIAGLSLVAGGGVPQTSQRVQHDATAIHDAMGTVATSTADPATVTASGPGGQPETRTTTTSTLAESGPATTARLPVRDGQTVGVAMPITVEFDKEIPPAARPEIQRRLSVETNPPQPGVWSWDPSGSQVWYRAPDYWKPGTTITVRASLAGVPMGNGTVGDADRSATVTVGNKVFMYVSNQAKHMQVYINDQLVRVLPVSLGKPSTPSSSGFMVVMSKEPQATFDTRGSADPYVVDVQWAMRLTRGGEYIHSAPWSVGAQGRYNVSHGCTNLSPTNAKWLFDQAHVGDPIIVKDTEDALHHGNGWTAWNLPWSEYVKGSALPVPPELANAVGVDPATGIPPTPTAAVATSTPSQRAATPGLDAVRPTD